jgi:multidrug efflux pump subunit AcrB
LPPREAAIRGAREVAMPVFAAVTTTMAAFLPMLLTSGEIGKFIRVIPIVVTVALLCSLIESFLVLPSHLADWIPPLPKAAGQTHPPRGAFWYLARYFESLIRVAVRRRYQVCIITTTILVTFIVYALTLHPPFQLFGEFEAKTFYVNVESPSGLSLEQTEAAIAPVEEACLALPESELQSLTTTIGMQLDLNTGQPDYRKNLAQLTVELVEIEFRDRTGAEIVQSLREDLGVVPGLVSVEFVETQAGPAGPDLELVFEGEELEILDRLTREVMTYLEGLPGVHDVARDHAPGKGEVQVEVLREGRALGFTEASLGRQVTAAFEGLEASHIRTVRDDAVIRVRYPAAYRADPRATEELRLRRPAGGWVNLGDVARTTRAPGLLQIQRTGGVRAITVTAKVDRQLSTPLEVTSAFRDHFDGELASRYPGCRVSYRGEQKDTEESMLSLLQAFLLAVLLIYGIIASLFRSYAQALAVLVAVPFGWCGVIAGHMVSWEPLSFMSMLGTVALTGIVVNDSVVLVQFINVRRREGMERSRAIAQAARIRLRAVILTSLTTICGLCPLAFFATGQARFLAPMAVAIVWGLLFSTVGVLVVVPCSYAIIDDLVAWLGRLLRLPSWQQGTVTVAVGENAPGSPDPDSSVTSPGDRG